MFDKIVLAPHRTQTQYVTREVHEHRAPTDASVKLLKEMEEKAEAKLIEAVHVGDAVFECVVHTFKNHLEDSTTLRAIFSLNKKRMTVDHVFRHEGQDEAWVALRDKMAEEIATTVLIPALKGR